MIVVSLVSVVEVWREEEVKARAASEIRRIELVSVEAMKVFFYQTNRQTDRSAKVASFAVTVSITGSIVATKSNLKKSLIITAITGHNFRSVALEGSSSFTPGQVVKNKE